MQSEFKEKVYDIVRNIPKGSALSYKEVAIQAGRPQAARSVANIMAKNFDPEIPCHRVLRSNGSLAGYNRGGTQKKHQLLKAEGFII